MSSAARGEATPRRVAMNCLARREHSVEELRRKLAARDFESAEIEATLADLRQDGLLSDSRFAEAFVRARSSRGQGPIKLQAELKGRGLGRELIAAALDPLDWGGIAAAAREKKFGPEIPVEFAARARQARFLQYRGFGSEHIRRALAGDWDQD